MTDSRNIIYLINIGLCISLIERVVQRRIQCNDIPFYLLDISVIRHVYITRFPLHRFIRIPIGVPTMPHSLQPSRRREILHANKIPHFVGIRICHTETIITRHHFFRSNISTSTYLIDGSLNVRRIIRSNIRQRTDRFRPVRHIYYRYRFSIPISSLTEIRQNKSVGILNISQCSVTGHL